MSETDSEPLADENQLKINSSPLKSKANLWQMGLGAALGAATMWASIQLKAKYKWKPNQLGGEELPKQIQIIMKQKLSEASEEEMLSWSLTVCNTFENTLQALARKHDLKEPNASPRKIVTHLFDKKLINEPLRDKLYNVIENRNCVIHEQMTKDTLRMCYKEFEDVLPVLSERL